MWEAKHERRQRAGAARPRRGSRIQSENVFRAVLADGDSLARNALRDALHRAGVAVVGQAADAAQAVNLVARCTPDVVVIDAVLAPRGAMAALKLAIAAHPPAAVIVLGQSGEDDAGLTMLAQGAGGYLSRATDLGGLARAIARAPAGEAAISRAMTRRVIERLRAAMAPTAGLRPVKSSLTQREWEVLDLMTAGASIEEIAGELVLTTDTVHTHVRHIFRKLHAHSRAEAVEVARRAREHPEDAA